MTDEANVFQTGQLAFGPKLLNESFESKHSWTRNTDFQISEKFSLRIAKLFDNLEN